MQEYTATANLVFKRLVQVLQNLMLCIFLREICMLCRNFLINTKGIIQDGDTPLDFGVNFQKRATKPHPRKVAQKNGKGNRSSVYLFFSCSSSSKRSAKF